jgi:hypothetical protein
MCDRPIASARVTGEVRGAQIGVAIVATIRQRDHVVGGACSAARRV